MAARSPSAPGADYLDDAVERLRAMKTTLGLVLARALTSIGSRFLVLGSAIAVIDARTAELEKRDNISWPALDRRFIAAEARLTDAEQVLSTEANSRIGITNDLRRRVESLEVFRDGGEPGNLGAEGVLEALERRVGALESHVASSESVSLLDEDLKQGLAELRDRVGKAESDTRGALASLTAEGERLRALMFETVQLKRKNDSVARALRTAADLLEGTGT